MLDKILYSKQLKRILVLFTALSALCLILSLTYPLARKAQAVNQVGARSLSSMTSFSLAMTYNSDEEISRLAREPGMDDSYKSLCGLLTSVKDAYGYNRVYLLYKGVGGKLYTLLDSGYRDNAREGVDYNGPTTQYKPLSGKAKSAIDKVFSKKEPRITAGGIAETVDGVKVVSSYVPVYSRSGEIIAVLGVDAGLSSGMVFDRVGVIDLNWLAGISAICGATGVLLLYFWVKLIRRRAKAAAEQAAQGVEAPEPLQLAAEDPAPEEPEAEQPSEDAPDGEDPPRP